MALPRRLKQPRESMILSSCSHQTPSRVVQKKPEVVKVLCGNSGADVDWLVEKFNLDLSLVARLGGHSAPRTHRGKERFPGMTITYALIQMVENVAEKTDRARIITKARAHKLLTNPDSGNACVGLVYEKG